MQKIRIIVYCPPEGCEVVHITNDLTATTYDLVNESEEFILSDTIFECNNLPSDFPLNRGFVEI